MEKQRPDPQSEALKKVYDKHARSLCNFADEIINHWDEANSIVNDAFLQLHKKGTDFTSPKIIGLLYSVIKCDCLDYLRKKGVWDRKLRRWFRENAELEENPAYANGIIKAELLDMTYQALAKLPRAQRAAIEGFYLHNLSAREIAEKYGIADQTVHNSKRKGLLGMMEYLGSLKKNLGEK